MDVVVRKMTDANVADAERVCRRAFGTFFGLPDPMSFRGDGEAVRGRFHTYPEASFVAEADGRVVGSGVNMDWGSVAILGPLTVDVDYWSRGIARALMDPVTQWIDASGFDFVGLLTHPQSPKHIRLYEAYGYAMDRITAVMGKPIAAAGLPPEATLFSALSAGEREAARAACREVADTIHPGLDLGREIDCAAELGFGDTLLLARDGVTVGFAVCHHGARSEASSARLMVKFAAVRSGPGAADDFARLLAACEGLAAARGAPEIHAGTNAGRRAAYRIMQRAGYRTIMNGIAMLRPETVGYNRPDAFVIDDWR